MFSYFGGGGMPKILLTGGSGFLGTHVLEALKREYSGELLAPTRQELDLTNLDRVREYWDFHKPTALVHGAAFARGLGGNIAAAEKAFLLNEQVIRTPLLAALEFGVEQVVFVGTVAEFGYPYEALPIREESVLRGLPHEGEIFYGLAKRLSNNYLDAIRVRWQARTAHLYLTNMYGPGDRFDTESGHVVASMMKKFWEQRNLKSDQISLWGSPSTTRDFIFVKDAAAAVCRVLSALPVGHLELNIASGTETRMADLAEKIAMTVGFGGEIVWDESKPIGIKHRSVSTQRLKGLMSFDPTNLDSGLLETAKSQGWAR